MKDKSSKQGNTTEIQQRQQQQQQQLPQQQEIPMRDNRGVSVSESGVVVDDDLDDDEMTRLYHIASGQSQDGKISDFVKGICYYMTYAI